LFFQGFRVILKEYKNNQKQMKITQKILAGLGVVALATGSLLGTPAKADNLFGAWNLTGGLAYTEAGLLKVNAPVCGVSCDIESSLRAIGQTKNGTRLPAPVVVPVKACVVVHDRICFESQAQYDRYMGWGPQQQRLERNANKC
jgi:hypothetical protein